MLSLIPRMVERGHGVFVNVGSVAGRIGSPQEAAYSGSKFALTGFTEAAAVVSALTDEQLEYFIPTDLHALVAYKSANLTEYIGNVMRHFEQTGGM
jgi:short-subunit dehydrogenase